MVVPGKVIYVIFSPNAEDFSFLTVISMKKTFQSLLNSVLNFCSGGPIFAKTWHQTRIGVI